MRHHAGQLGFIVRFQNESGVHKEESARQCEGIHFFAVDDLDGERNLGIGIPHQVLTYAIDVLGNHRVIDDFSLTLYFRGQLLAQGNLFFERVEVDLTADVPIADLIGVFLRVLCEHAARRNQRQKQAKNSG